MPLIHVVPIDLAGEERLDFLIRDLAQIFGRPAALALLPVDLTKAYDSHRGQYKSTEILKQLLEQTSGGTDKILGIVDVDLFVPILTFVFGEAQLEGTVAVVSRHRLSNRYYGLPEDQSLLGERLLKEAVHELGHTFGLIHCTDNPCVMNSSTYVERIDLKPLSLCDDCCGFLRKIKNDNAVGQEDRSPWWHKINPWLKTRTNGNRSNGK